MMLLTSSPAGKMCEANCASPMAPATADNASTTGTPFYTDTTIFTFSWSGVPVTSAPFDPVAAGWTLGTDVDGDSVFDLEDNCLLVKNAPPLDCDTDKDGYGNVCDGDFSQDFAVNASDFNTYFLAAFKIGVDKAGVGIDMNCDGMITAVDFTTRFIPHFKAGKLGPSGLSCAGVAPCDL